MKKVFILTFLISFLIANANPPSNGLREYKSIFELEKLKFEAKKELVLLCIIHKESRGNPLAYNPSEDAVGILQIRKIYVDECNRISGKHFKYEDRWDKEKSIEMFFTMFDVKCPSYSLDSVAMIHNSGGKTSRHWRITKEYRKDVTNNFNKLNKLPMNVYLVDNEVIVASNTAKEVRQHLAKLYNDDSYLHAFKVESKKLKKRELLGYKIFSNESYDTQGRTLSEIIDDIVGDETQVISIGNWEEI